MYKKNLEMYERLDGWERVAIGEQLRRWAKKYQDKVAFIAESGEITYKEFDIETEKVARGFLKLGIKAGDKVVLQMPNVMSYPVPWKMVPFFLAFFRMSGSNTCTLCAS